MATLFNKNLFFNYFLISFTIIIIVNSQSTILSRKKRYVVFPEGSSFSAALCMTIQVYEPTNIFTEGLNWGIAYDLPNDTRNDILPEFKGPRPVLMRRRRSELYNKFETLMDSAGINGRACVSRTLCEVTQRLSKGNNLIDELIRIIFHFPHEDLSDDEPSMHQMYHLAYKTGMDGLNCNEFYNECPFSLLDLAFSGFETY